MAGVLVAATVILVHGAFADGSSWSKVIPLLQEQSLNVVAVQNPLSSLADDVAATKRAIALAQGPVVLVGHSWGGAVITEAGIDEKVKSLVYVAAFAPPPGASVTDLSRGAPPAPWQSKVIVDKSGFISLPPAVIAEDFAQDLPKETTAIMAATQGQIAARAFDDKVSAAAWMSKSSWYVVASKDRMIAPEYQSAFAKATKAHTTEVESSHVPMLSHPHEVASVILDAAKSAVAVASR